MSLGPAELTAVPEYFPEKKQKDSVKNCYTEMLKQGTCPGTLPSTLFLLHFITPSSGSMTFWCGSGSGDPCL